jgi:para-nitrobenzyl esterase
MPKSEDCLYLNVITPARKADEKLPVIVYMHGGGLQGGSGNDGMTNAIRLPLNGVVLVNVNMRLGALGCFAHPLLSRESPRKASGNYLFLDMVAALKWVQTNISAFGGNPGNVTIMGHSGGSNKVINLMASPLAKGLFHRAIAQSGGRMAGSDNLGEPLRETEALGEKILTRLGVNQNGDPLAAARALPWEKIVEAGAAVAAEVNVGLAGPWSSTVDGWFLADTPAAVFKAGKQNVVPFMIGSTLGELTGPGLLVMPQWIPDYVNLLKGAGKVAGKAYAYIFDHVPAGWKKDGVVSAHGVELHYVFGDWDPKGNVWPMGFLNARPSGAKSANPGLTVADQRLSEKVMRIWANFARTGSPSLKGVVDWPAWEEATDRYLYITESPEVRSGFSKVAQK